MASGCTIDGIQIRLVDPFGNTTSIEPARRGESGGGLSGGWHTADHHFLNSPEKDKGAFKDQVSCQPTKFQHLNGNRRGQASFRTRSSAPAFSRF